MVLDVRIDLERALLDASKPRLDPAFMDVWNEHPQQQFSRLQQQVPPLEQRTLLTSGEYRVRTASTLQDVDFSLQMVYTNYSLRETPWIQPMNPRATVTSFRHREVPDAYQTIAHVLILEHEGQPIGSVRVIPQSRLGLPATNHAEEKQKEVEHVLAQYVPHYFLLEPSRLVVLEEFQKGPGMGLLMAGMYGLAKDYETRFGSTAFIFEADEKGIELYEKLGGVATPFKALHPVGEELTLMTWKLEDSRYAPRWNRVLNTEKTHAHVN